MPSLWIFISTDLHLSDAIHLASPSYLAIELVSPSVLAAREARASLSCSMPVGGEELQADEEAAELAIRLGGLQLVLTPWSVHGHGRALKLFVSYSSGLCRTCRPWPAAGT